MEDDYTRASTRPCRDPECSGVAEPEQDQDHCTYWACPECGYEFGHVLIGKGEDETCQIGVPEEIRKAASAPMQAALAEQTKGLPMLQIGKRSSE